jgi:lipoprotein signal peptidase
LTQPTPKIGRRIFAQKAFWVAVPAVIVLDQVAKGLAQLTLKPDGWEVGDPQPHYRFIEGIVHGTWATGEMFAFGGTTPWPAIVFAALFWSAVFYFVLLRSQPRQWLLRIGGGMMLGTLVTNLIDTAMFGGVRNFMLLGFDNPFSQTDPGRIMQDGIYASRPSFSTAAVSGWLGMAALVIGAFIGKRKKQPPAPPPPPKPRPDSKRPYGHQSAHP